MQEDGGGKSTRHDSHQEDGGPDGKVPTEENNTNIAITRECSSKYTQHAFTISSGHPICKYTEHSKVVVLALSFHCIGFCPPPHSGRRCSTAPSSPVFHCARHRANTPLVSPDWEHSRRSYCTGTGEGRCSLRIYGGTWRWGAGARLYLCDVCECAITLHQLT